MPNKELKSIITVIQMLHLCDIGNRPVYRFPRSFIGQAKKDNKHSHFSIATMVLTSRISPTTSFKNSNINKPTTPLKKRTI